MGTALSCLQSILMYGYQTCKTKTNNNVFLVVSRWESRLLRKVADTNHEIADYMNILDRQIIEYVSFDLEQIKQKYLEFVQKNSTYNNDMQRGWTIQSIYLIQTQTDREIEKGILNEGKVFAWSSRYGQVVENGIQQYIVNGKPAFYVV